MHYYQHHIGDYLSATTHLTLLEHGAYLRLMMLYYQNECALDANAFRMICARSAEEIQAAETVLAEFFEKTENGWIHRRCDEEIANFHSKSTKASASARARWDKKNADAMRTHSEGNANHKPLTINQEPDIAASPPVSKADTQRNELILTAYNEELGDVLQKATKLSDKRKKAINARWAEYLNTEGMNGKVRFTDEQSGVEWFRKVFRKVKLNPHWIGESNAQWRADFDWLMNPNNLLKVVEYVPVAR